MQGREQIRSGAVRPRPVSRLDVARRAGVSAQTVSRVINGDPAVLGTTSQRVKDAMTELGYRPNRAARALKYGEFRSLGVMLFNLTTTGNSRTLEAIAAQAAEQGYSITLLPVFVPTQDQVSGAFSRLDELAVDAVIAIVEVHLLDSATITLPPGSHVVVVDSDAGDRYSVVDNDHAGGARQAVRHLLELGHRTVWHVAGPQESFAAERRANSWREELHLAGRPVPALLRGDWSAESGYRAGLRLLQEPDCTAVFAANDQMALGVLRALQTNGRRVPEQVSVVGFDDTADSAQYLPPLTTVHQDFAEVGRRCVDQALRQIRGEQLGHGTVLVPTRLVVRDSTGVPPGPA